VSWCTVWRREDNPELHDFYSRKLLEPSWAGELNKTEFAYIKSQLRQSLSLRRRWGFRPSARRLSETHIRALAMHGTPRGVGRVSALPVGGKQRQLKDSRVRPTRGSSDTKTPSLGRQDGNKTQTLGPMTSGGGQLAVVSSRSSPRPAETAGNRGETQATQRQCFGGNSLIWNAKSEVNHEGDEAC